MVDLSKILGGSDKLLTNLLPTALGLLSEYQSVKKRFDATPNSEIANEVDSEVVTSVVSTVFRSLLQDENFINLVIMPLLKKRYPDSVDTLVHTEEGD